MLKFHFMSEVLVFDLGSSTFKVGFASENNPKAVIHSCVGRRRYKRSIVETKSNKSYYVGEEAQIMRGICNINYAISPYGTVNNFDDYEALLHHSFYNTLKVAPEEHPLLGSHSNNWSVLTKEIATQIAFETFNVPAFYLVPQGIVAIYESGRGTGILVSVGESTCETYPIYEGYCSTHAVKSLDVAGKHLTEYFAKLLTERGYSFTNSADMEAVRELKEKSCYIPLNQQLEWKQSQLTTSLTKEYQLPDGEKILVGNESFRCPEVLFKPDLLGAQDKPGIHEIIHSTIVESDLDCQKDYCGNIIIAGGSSKSMGKKIFNHSMPTLLLTKKLEGFQRD